MLREGVLVLRQDERTKKECMMCELYSYILAHDPLGQVDLFWRESVVKHGVWDHVAHLDGGGTGRKCYGSEY